MTAFYLIRHAHVEPSGRWLAGRRPGVHLTERGRREAAALADALAGEPIRRVLSSPLERAQETARPLADRLRVEAETAAELIELDFGQWTGRTLRELEDDPRWRQFNVFRSGTRIPGGESMLEVQARAVGLMQRLAEAHPDDFLALVTHGDVIRAALCWALGMSLEGIHRIEIEPASISLLRLNAWGATVAAMNFKRT